MPVPKRKTSRARKGKRNSGKGLSVKAITTCSNCSAALATHQACSSCGFYKGSKVLRTKGERLVRRTELKQAQQARQKTQQEEAPQESDVVEAEVEDVKDKK